MSYWSDPFHSLINSDVLLDESSNFVGLFSLDPGDPLLHQVATLHVQKQSAIISLNFSSGDYFGEWVMKESFMGDQIKKTDSILVECQDMLRSFTRIALTAYLKSKRAITQCSKTTKKVALLIMWWNILPRKSLIRKVAKLTGSPKLEPWLDWGTVLALLPNCFAPYWPIEEVWCL